MSDTPEQKESSAQAGWIGDTLQISPERRAEFSSVWTRSLTMILDKYPETVCVSCRSIIARDEQFTSEVIVVRRSNATEASMINVSFRCLPCTITAGYAVVGEIPK